MGGTTIHVVSDLHLGGAAGTGDDPGFQMCSRAGQSRLAGFFRWVRDRTDHLVLAGDVVDFLAETDEGGFLPLTVDDARATRRLARILNDTAPVWEALRDVVASGAAVTLLLGNHDVELSLPGPRALLLDRLGPGRVEIVYDGQGLALGEVFVEHGNRYDRWNAVAHDDLRRLRSAVSRRLPPPPVVVQPGSVLVARVMNELKQDWPWVDLLKPETACVLPLLAFLAPVTWKREWGFVNAAWAASAVTFEQETGEPINPNLIAAMPSKDRAAVALAHDLAAGGSANTVGLLDLADFLLRWGKAELRRVEGKGLRQALRALEAGRTRAFDPTVEDATYLIPAKARVAAGFRVVVMGHTHLPKRVTIDQSVYVNTGTWADVLRVPDAVYDGSDADLEGFVDELLTRKGTSLRRQIPTFAEIVVHGDAIDAQVRLWEGDGATPVVTADLLAQRLGGSS